jgi:hypothetical protein
MVVLKVEKLSFTFPSNWLVSKYDDWKFYRKQFMHQFNGIQAVDVLAKDPNGRAYLIEVKDYRHPDSEKPSQLPQTIANKVLMTLAAMLPAKLKANDPNEAEMATAVLTCKSLTVVVHVELPRAHQPAVNPADLRQKLGQLLHVVDAHPKIVSQKNMRNLAWTVA